MNTDPLALHAAGLGRNCYVDLRRVALAELPKLPRRTMREHRIGPASDHGRQPVPLDPKAIVADRVDAPMQPDESSCSHPLSDPMRAEPKRAELPPADHAPLPPGNPLQPG